MRGGGGGTQLVPLRRQVRAMQGCEYSRLPLWLPLTRKLCARRPRQGRAHKTPGGMPAGGADAELYSLETQGCRNKN